MNLCIAIGLKVNEWKLLLVTCLGQCSTCALAQISSCFVPALSSKYLVFYHSLIHSLMDKYTNIHILLQFMCSQRILMQKCHIPCVLLSKYRGFTLSFLLRLFSLSQLLSRCAQTSPTLLQMMTTSPFQGTGFLLKLKTSCISKRSVCSQITCTIITLTYIH